LDCGRRTAGFNSGWLAFHHLLRRPICGTFKLIAGLTHLVSVDGACLALLHHMGQLMGDELFTV